MKKIVLIVVALLLAAGAVGLLLKRRADLAKAVPAGALPVVVEALELHKGPLILTLPALALATSAQSSTLSTRLTGTVVSVYKKEGDPVKKGEKIARIDARELAAQEAGIRARVEGIESDIAMREENHQRTLRLLAVKGAALEESRQEEAAITGLKKSRESLLEGIRENRLLQGYATITAPVDGTLSELTLQVGDLAMPGKALGRVAARSGLSLTLALPETATAKVIVVNGKRLPLAPKNQATATGLAQYVANLPEGSGLIDGQYCNVRVVIHEGEGVLVPVDALLSIGGGTYVFVLTQNQAERIPVEVATRGSEGVVLRQELAGRTIVVAKPDILLRLASGAPVLIKPQLLKQ